MLYGDLIEVSLLRVQGSPARHGARVGSCSLPAGFQQEATFGAPREVSAGVKRGVQVLSGCGRDADYLGFISRPSAPL